MKLELARGARAWASATLDAIYLKLGQTEIDDMAAGIKALWTRPYFDKGRVGIYGTSYGGYASAMTLLRHPDVWAAASASSPVTAWRHYDTIYTERYMWIPQENKAGYDAGSAMTYAENLKGRLLLYYGTADNNVHPNNSMQLIQALQQAGKSFEVQVGPDAGHTRRQPAAHDGVLHREPRRPPAEGRAHDHCRAVSRRQDVSVGRPERLTWSGVETGLRLRDAGRHAGPWTRARRLPLARPVPHLGHDHPRVGRRLEVTPARRRDRRTARG